MLGLLASDVGTPIYSGTAEFGDGGRGRDGGGSGSILVLFPRLLS